MLLLVALPAVGGEVSMEEAQRLLREEAKDANTLFSLSFYFEQAGRPFSALRACERAIEVDPKVPGYHARMGQLFAARKRLREAALAYGRAAEMDPNTKSFRAAEARALSGCWMLKEAARSWKMLLDGAATRDEILDAARNLAGIEYQNNNPAGAEAAWVVALGKLPADKWDDRVVAAEGVSQAMLAGKAAGRAMDFWQGLFDKEPDWERRAAIADRMMNLVSQAPAEFGKLHDKAEAAWRKLLAEAGKPADRQRAALAVAGIDLRAGESEKAIEALKPVLYVHEWSANFGVAQTLARAYAAAGKAAEREALWREFLAKCANFNQRYQVAEQLAAVLEDKEAVIKVRRELAESFPAEISAHERLAEALAAADKHLDAVAVYETILPLVRKQRGYQVNNEYGYWQQMVALCAQAEAPEKALELIKSRFGGVDEPWQVCNWLSSIRGSCGEYAALNAADKVAALGGVRRFGAAQFLYSYSGRREAARPLFEAAAGDGGLTRQLRRNALQNLMGFARTGAERVALARRMVELGGDRWERHQDFCTLASELARQGEIEEGAKTVRQADGLRENNWRSGPDVLNHLGSAIFQGNRVGPGLRTPEGQKKAEDAVEALYKDFAAEEMYRYGLCNLASNLAELHARRGDYDGAVELLHRLCAARESSALRVSAAGLLDRKGADPEALAEYLAYADAAAAEHAAQLARRADNHHWLPSVDGRCLSFLETKGKDADFEKHAAERMEKLAGHEREGVADLLLSFLRQRNRPEDMQALLKKLKNWGHSDQFYRQQEEWVAAAIKMKNASSQADAQRREALLADARRWEKTLGENSEDYGAAVNAYKTYVLLGRKESDGQKFLARVKETAEKQRDPLVLELWGRELMLEKSYASAARAFEIAAEVTGRRTDYEESIMSSLELAGKQKEAVDLALDSMEQGRSNGRGFRNVEQILDVAERSDNLKHLYAQVKGRVEKALAANRPLREELAQLGLRLAWDNADDKLAATAIDSLVAQSKDPLRPWQDEWRLQALAGRAVERRRLADAVRIREAIVAAHSAAGYAPDLGEYQALAGLLLESGKAPAAADLMFDGLARAGQGENAPRIRPQPRPWNGRRLREAATADGAKRGGGAGEGGAGPLVRRDDRLPWISAIIGLAAREADGGGKVFKDACGERLSALLEDEMKLLEKSPVVYSGPALSFERSMGLGERITAAFRAAAKAEKATSGDHLALARRLVALATLQPKERRPEGIKIEEIVSAGDEAAKRAEAKDKAKVLMEGGRLYRQLLSVDEKDRMPGAKPELALSAFEAAASARSERWGLDAIREALAVAQQFKSADKVLEYARKLSESFPSDVEMRYTLAGALVAKGQAKEALALLNSALGKDAAYGDYLRAGDTCMTPISAGPPPVIMPEAAGGAADLYKAAIAAYLEEVGKQVDPKGQPLPDRELGRLQGKLADACAAEGRPAAALDALVASVFNSGGEAMDQGCAVRLAEAYAKAGKQKELVAELSAKVKAEPGSLNLRLAQAAVLEKFDDFAGAAVALSAAKAIKPELSIVKRLVEMLRKAGQVREAFAECRDWTSAFPRDAEAWRALAAIYKDLKDEDGETAALTMLVEVAPREAANCRQVAVLFAERKDWPRAVGLMERAVELRPEEPYRHVDLAEVLYMSAVADVGAQHAAPLLERAAKICSEALAKDWEKGLAPELLARMPPWRGTFETRAQSVLADACEALKKPEDAARARLNVPAGYKRPALKDAVPTPGFRNWWGPQLGFRGGGIE